MGETFLDRHGIKSGIKLNDVIEEFKYVYKGQEVKAGDFVNYINGLASNKDYGESVDTQLSTEAYTGSVISVVQLDENRVFIAHSHTSSSDGYLYGIVCTVNGATITCGTDTQLSTQKYSGYAISTVLLPNGNVFIAHCYGGTYWINGMVCSIDGTTITTGEDTTITSNGAPGKVISACLLPNGNIFIAHSYNTSSYYLYGIVCTISGTTITAGTDTALVNSTNAGYAISTCLLPNGNVFIAHSYGSSYYLYGMVCSISGTTITSGSDTAIVSSTSAGSHISTCLLANGNVFIAHSYGSDSYLYGIVISINGTAITKGTDVNLGDGRYFTGYAISTCLLPNGDVFIAHNWDRYDYYLYGMIVSIDGTTITKKTDIALSDTTFQGQVISALLLPNGTIFIAHSNTEDKYYLYAQIFAIDYDNNIPTNNIVITEYEQQVTPAIEPPFNAVALSSGVGAPEFVEGEVEVTKTGNIFNQTWNEEVAGTKYSSSDRYILEADSIYSSSFYVVNACDDVSNNMWKSGQGTSHWVCMTLPTPIKITKMKAEINATAIAYFDNAIIQGSINGSEWVDLYSTSTIISTVSEITLSNTDYYKYYRILYTLKSSSEVSEDVLLQTAILDEWQVSEYVEKEIQQIPSTEHNEQVKIARVYKEVEVEKSFVDNIFPTSLTKVSDTEYVAEDGTVITASGIYNSSYEISNAFDNNLDTCWMSQISLTEPNYWLKIKPSKLLKISRMKINVYSQSGKFENAVIQGSNNDSEWVDLYTMTIPQTSTQEVNLNNVDWYEYYRIFITSKLHSDGHYACGIVYEWKTSECIAKVTEVIQ